MYLLEEHRLHRTFLKLQNIQYNQSKKSWCKIINRPPTQINSPFSCLAPATPISNKFFLFPKLCPISEGPSSPPLLREDAHAMIMDIRQPSFLSLFYLLRPNTYCHVNQKRPIKTHAEPVFLIFLSTLCFFFSFPQNLLEPAIFNTCDNSCMRSFNSSPSR